MSWPWHDWHGKGHWHHWHHQHHGRDWSHGWPDKWHGHQDWHHWQPWHDWSDWSWHEDKGKGKGKGKTLDAATLAQYSSAELTTDGVLGCGASGVTLKGRFRVAGETVPVAVKTSSNSSELEALKRIAAGAASVAVSGVVPVLAIDHATALGSVQVLQLASHGTLGNVLDKNGVRCSGTLLAMIESMAIGLSELHMLQILHCDLKPENVAIHATGGGTAELWLIDFGDARLADDWSEWHLQGPGDPAIKCKPDVQSNNFSEATDMWCLAQTVAWLFEGRQPHNPAHLSGQMPLSQLLSWCLSWSPKDRPTAPSVVQAAQDERREIGEVPREIWLGGLLDRA
mmetsp:Transcript_82528/g.198035  ORF Transcript_82528/g.198035 Transcript_82528/m.198035 type:complete len:341 (+) Transcript_82528:105-1127(+)